MKKGQYRSLQQRIDHYAGRKRKFAGEWPTEDEVYRAIRSVPRHQVSSWVQDSGSTGTTDTGGVSSTTITVTLQANQLVLVLVESNVGNFSPGTITVSDPTNGTYHQPYPGGVVTGGGAVYLWGAYIYGTASGSTTITVACSNGFTRWGVSVCGFTNTNGPITADPFDNKNSNNPNGSTSSLTTNSAPISGSDDLLLGAFTISDGGGGQMAQTMSAVSGTQIHNINNSHAALLTEYQSGLSLSTAATASTSANVSTYGAMGLSFKAPAGGNYDPSTFPQIATEQPFLRRREHVAY